MNYCCHHDFLSIARHQRYCNSRNRSSSDVARAARKTLVRVSPGPDTAAPRFLVHSRTCPSHARGFHRCQLNGVRFLKHPTGEALPTETLVPKAADLRTSPRDPHPFADAFLVQAGSPTCCRTCPEVLLPPRPRQKALLCPPGATAGA